MPRVLILLLALAALAYVGICVALYAYQRSLIYFPPPATPAQLLHTIRLPVPDAQLAVSVQPHDGPGALVYFGGNAEDVSQALPTLASAFPDRAIYLLHYRGFGGSTGSASEEALQQDALALYDLVRAAHADIFIVGRSLGSGVALRLASQRAATRVILVTPYDSLQELAARQFPVFPVAWLLRDKYESWRYAPSITVPVTLIAADRDEIVPRASTDKLLTRFAPGIAQLRVLPGTTHNTIGEGGAYLQLLRSLD